MRLLVLLLCLIAPVSAFAELYSSKINFKHVLANKDVVLGVVQSIYQDKDGFIWFGGENALVRFDGYTLRQFNLSDEKNPTKGSKPVTRIPSMFEDSKGKMWVTSGIGLLQYKSASEMLVRLPDHSSLKDTPISAVETREVVELPDGKMAVATYSGLYIVDSVTGEGKIYRESQGLSPGRINSVAYTGGDDLWVGTGTGLDRFNIKTGKIVNIKPYPEKSDSSSDNGVSSILPTKDGKLWLGTDRGLIKYEIATSKYKRYEHDEKDPSSFSGGDIWDLFTDSNGYLWIATDGGGLNMFDPIGEKFVRFQHDSGRTGSLNSNVVRAVIEDRNGDMWVGNYPGGVNFFDKSSAAIDSYVNAASDPQSLSYDSVMSLAEGRAGNLWVGTDGAGLDFFDRSTGTFTHYKSEKNNENSIGANAVLSLMIDSKNILWGGTWAGGVFQVDLNNKNRITRLPGDARRVVSGKSQSKKLNNDKVWCIFEDSKKIIWFCSHEGGLSSYNRASGDFTHYTADAADSDSISGNQVWLVFEDKDRVFWVGTTNGLAILDRETGKFSNFEYVEGKANSLSNPSILSAFQDSKGRLWFGSNVGLNLYNKETNDFTSFGIKDGFVNDSIRSIVEDNAGRLWMGTNSGVIAFDPESKKVKNYNRESGNLIGGFNYQAALMTRSGEAVFGGKQGLRIYQTDKMQDNLVKPEVVITDFKVFSDSVVIGGEDGLLDRSVNLTDSLTLDYKKSVFEFDFAALNYRDSGKNRHAYKLEGFDEDWLDVGDQRRAKYTNLDAGVYTFRVKGSNNDGVWNDVGKSVTIIQLPPPWQTWWAYTIYGLTVVGLAYWFVRSQRRKRELVEEQNRMLEVKVSERTSELSKKNKDIQAMLGNMQQGLFTVESTGNIHPEYSAYLESIFEERGISGTNALDFLFSKASLGGDLLNQVKEAMGAMIGEDEMNYGFNSHLLVGEYDIVVEGNTKNLSLDWNPIIIDDIVEKLMVTVRDITELKSMEAQSKSKQRELDIIVQLLNIPSKKYLNFELTAAGFLKEARQIVAKNTVKTEDAIAVLFRNMHTIKGNCRTFNFNHISDVVHEVETTYSNMKKSDDIVWSQEVLMADIDRVEQALAEYSSVYRDVLGRGDSVGDRGEGMWLDAVTIKGLQDNIRNIQLEIPKFAENKYFKPVGNFFAKALSKPIDVMLADIVESLPSIAEQLNKDAPEVHIESSDIRFKDSSSEFMNNIFTHILRNCIDHGIEGPDERVSKGKPRQGTIKLFCSFVKDKLQICVSDDGRGVNIDRLFEKGIELGRWSKQDKPKTSAIANLIFESGVSTKDEITDISGRGVGLDAVKQFILNKGGDISLRLLGEQSADNAYVAFEIVLELPNDLYQVIKGDNSAAAA